MEPFVPKFSHRRYDPLMGQWIIVSPHRITRPWSGQIEKDSKGKTDKLSGDDEIKVNPLCPGATRSSGLTNPLYDTTFMFPNDFPALDTIQQSDQIEWESRTDVQTDPIFAWSPAQGDCQVMCFHQDSNKTLALMQPHEVRQVVDDWGVVTKRYREDTRRYEWLQIFENRGAAVGCSNLHPHCQIWACGFLPSLATQRDYNQRKYFQKFLKPLLLDYAHKEEQISDLPNSRVVIKSNHWLVLVPWWACWPFETLILPRNRHIRWLYELTSDERDSLVTVIQELLTRYDNLFQTDFPYSMGWYQAPLSADPSVGDEQQYAHWQLHAIYQPPLLRSASVRKFMSGFELLAEAQRDLLPELAASMLRDVPSSHYTLKETK